MSDHLHAHQGAACLFKFRYGDQQHSTHAGILVGFADAAVGCHAVTLLSGFSFTAFAKNICKFWLN